VLVGRGAALADGSVSPEVVTVGCGSDIPDVRKPVLRMNALLAGSGAAQACKPLWPVQGVIPMNGMLRISRSRGALSGVLLVLLGAWGGLIAFVGPYFHYAYTPDSAWSYTSGRLWLEILPGAGALLGGLIALASASRPVAMFGAWLAGLSGAWFALGTIIGHAWAGSGLSAGTPAGGPATQVVEQIGFFTGLGVVIVFLAALAFGRLTVVGARDGAPHAAAPTRRLAPWRRRAASQPEPEPTR
jgi:hypothetical protein